MYSCRQARSGPALAKKRLRNLRLLRVKLGLFLRASMRDTHHPMHRANLTTVLNYCYKETGTTAFTAVPCKGGRAMTEPGFLDQAPDTDKLTDYDKKYFKLYMRLLDAKADGADWKEAVQVLFGLDPDREPERARRMHDSHLARAQWMTEHGYRLLLAEGAGK